MWREAADGNTFAVHDPATGHPLAEVADAGPVDGEAALDAAARAQPARARSVPRERSELLRRAYDAVVAETEPLARLITLEMGKSLAESRAEVMYAAKFLRWYAEEAVRARGEYLLAPGGPHPHREARRGPCLLITPWNFPLAMATRKLGPSLAAGCTSVAQGRA